MDDPSAAQSSEDQAVSDGRSAAQQAANGLPPDHPPIDGSAIAWIFLNDRELRSGWRVLIFALLWLLIVVILNVLTGGRFHRSGAGATRSIFGGELLMLAAALAAAGILALAEKRSFGDYLLPWRRAFGSRFWRGVLWGLIALAALLGLICLFHGLRFGAPSSIRGRLLLDGGVVAAGFLAVGLFEEFFFRGYALFTLSGGMGFWPAAILLSAAFGAVHLGNRGEDWVGALTAALIGLFFCFTVRRTGDLWFAIGLHAMWDFSESFIFAVPDSGIMIRHHLFSSALHGPAWLTGGAVGPEGSVFALAVIAVLFIVFDRLHPAAKFPAAVGPQR
ncbi:MAG: lysostaphin resistance A-like protein [Terriglobia bacterium]